MVSGDEFQRNVALLTCLLSDVYCRCQKKCNLNHNTCSRGVLPNSLVHCHTSYSALRDSTLNYVTFETKNVETFGKGKNYTYVEKVETPVKYIEFQHKLRYAINLLSSFSVQMNERNRNE